MPVAREHRRARRHEGSRGRALARVRDTPAAARRTGTHQELAVLLDAPELRVGGDAHLYERLVEHYAVAIALSVAQHAVAVEEQRLGPVPVAQGARNGPPRRRARRINRAPAARRAPQARRSLLSRMRTMTRSLTRSASMRRLVRRRATTRRRGWLSSR